MSGIIHWEIEDFIQKLNELDTSGVALAILLIYAAHANQRGRAYPSTDRLVFATTKSRPTVTKGRRILLDLQILQEVPPKERIGDEKNLVHNRMVCQINHSAVVDGKKLPVFFVPAEERRRFGMVNELSRNEVNRNEVAGNEISPNIVLDSESNSSKKDRPIHKRSITEPPRPTGEGTGAEINLLRWKIELFLLRVPSDYEGYCQLLEWIRCDQYQEAQEYIARNHGVATRINTWLDWFQTFDNASVSNLHEFILWLYHESKAAYAAQARNKTMPIPANWRKTTFADYWDQYLAELHDTDEQLDFDLNGVLDIRLAKKKVKPHRGRTKAGSSQSFTDFSQQSTIVKRRNF